MRLFLLVLILGLVLAEDPGDDLVIASSGDHTDDLVIVASDVASEFNDDVEEDAQRDEATIVVDEPGEETVGKSEEFVDPADFVGSEVTE